MKEIPNTVPNQGSEEAIALGCICPVIDNHYGKGVQIGDDEEPVFWTTAGCKLHDTN